jgi:hypothetical protein
MNADERGDEERMLFSLRCLQITERVALLPASVLSVLMAGASVCGL